MCLDWLPPGGPHFQGYASVNFFQTARTWHHWQGRARSGVAGEGRVT
jgi:hypothetical protein